MSNYNEELGSIKLPSSEGAKIRKEFGTFLNKRYDTIHAFAVKTVERLLAKHKGKRTVDFRSEIQTALEEWDGDIYREYFGCNMDRIFFGGDKDRKRPLKPKRKDFPFVKFTQGVHFSEDDFRIQIKGNVATWMVQENNHAVERAHEHIVARKFFELISRVKWTRGTGGVFEYTDEYDGNGWSYFGPIGEKEEKARDESRYYASRRGIDRI